MNLRAVEYGGLAVLGVVAVALVASSLPAVQTGTGPDRAPPASGVGSGDGPAPGYDVGLDLDLGPLDAAGSLALALALLATLGYLLASWPRVALVVIAVAVTVAVLFAIAWVLPTLFSPRDVARPGFGRPLPIGGGGGGGRLLDRAVGWPVVLALFVVVGVVAFVALRTTKRRTDRDSAANGGPVGPADGRPSDRPVAPLEGNGDADATICGAWRSMTLLFEPSRSPAASPREYVTAAVDADVAPGDVAELTRLFERVRYGGYDPTGRDRRRAVAALRRIEAAHEEGTR